MRSCLLLAILLFAACSQTPGPVLAPGDAAGSSNTSTGSGALQVSVIAGPSPETSTIVIPIHATLQPLLPILEAQVPKTFSKLDGFEMDKEQKVGARYDIRRDSIVLNMQGSGLHATTTVHYALQGCRRTQNPFTKNWSMVPCVSCGFGEPMREAFIAIDSHLEWDQNWRIRSKTAVRPVEFPNRCTVTFLNIDISDWKIAPLVNRQLQEVAKGIDQNTPKLTDVRANAQQIWASIQAPAEIAPKVWLSVEPVDFALAPIRGSGLQVSSALVLQARTRVVVGERPASAAKPLPPLRTAAIEGGGIRVPFDVELPYEEASRLISEEVGKRTYKVSGGTLAVESIRLLPNANGRLTIEATIDYRGGGLKNYRGVVSFEGTPRFDADTNRVAIGDLDYSLERKRRNPFLRFADRVTHEGVRANLAANANWTIRDRLGILRSQIEQAIDRPLTAGVALHGKIDAVTAQGVLLRPEGIVIRVVATGRADIDVKDWR
ncbi:MAG TPA: DUF4403 family protein [Thermoanaerobaculia bacterium]|nr:DUF4403 family protein [Thermoanaerobaculia bacterium]